MCEPTTIASIGLAASVASTGLSAMSSFQQSKAARNQANYQAAVSRNNQIISERNAAEIEKQGKDEANRYRSRVRQMQADQTLSMAASGADITQGSSVDLLADTAELGERDAQQIEANAERQAYNARVQGMNHGAQAGLFTAQADAQSPLRAGASSLLSGAGTVASRWNRRPRASGGFTGVNPLAGGTPSSVI